MLALHFRNSRHKFNRTDILKIQKMAARNRHASTGPGECATKVISADFPTSRAIQIVVRLSNPAALESLVSSSSSSSSSSNKSNNSNSNKTSHRAPLASQDSFKILPSARHQHQCSNKQHPSLASQLRSQVRMTLSVNKVVKCHLSSWTLLPRVHQLINIHLQILLHLLVTIVTLRTLIFPKQMLRARLTNL